MRIDDSSDISGQMDSPIIFFDGVCGLCNKFVDWILRRDRQKIFRFASLQGDTARRILGFPQTDWPERWSVIYRDESGEYRRSTAVLKIFCRLGGGWGRLASFGFWIPQGFRDAVYDFVATRRYRWFGRMSSCRVSSAAERRRFWD